MKITRELLEKMYAEKNPNLQGCNLGFLDVCFLAREVGFVGASNLNELLITTERMGYDGEHKSQSDIELKEQLTLDLLSLLNPDKDTSNKS